MDAVGKLSLFYLPLKLCPITFVWRILSMKTIYELPHQQDYTRDLINKFELTDWKDFVCNADKHLHKVWPNQQEFRQIHQTISNPKAEAPLQKIPHHRGRAMTGHWCRGEEFWFGENVDNGFLSSSHHNRKCVRGWYCWNYYNWNWSLLSNKCFVPQIIIFQLPCADLI